MLRFIVKHRASLVIGSILLAMVYPVHLILPAMASVVPVPPGGVQENHQAYQGASDFNNVGVFVGHRQGNSGNPGINRGFNQDNDGNRGNQLSGQRKVIHIQNNQQFLHQSENGGGSGNSATFIGAFQGNSGNSGINLGNSQDNSGNSGNQVNNQANIIGTQINKQGSSVTNDGNIIQHQINYVDLVPGLGLYLSLKPKLQFAVSVGH